MIQLQQLYDVSEFSYPLKLPGSDGLQPNSDESYLLTHNNHQFFCDQGFHVFVSRSSRMLLRSLSFSFSEMTWVLPKSDSGDYIQVFHSVPSKFLKSVSAECQECWHQSHQAGKHRKACP